MKDIAEKSVALALKKEGLSYAENNKEFSSKFV